MERYLLLSATALHKDPNVILFLEDIYQRFFDVREHCKLSVR
jgi:hypothetical protein